MAACAGRWQGHVKFASELCAPGWDVCNWKTDGHVLSKISYTVGLSVEGCYAYNAAQDGGRCRECLSKLDQVIKNQSLTRFHLGNRFQFCIVYCKLEQACHIGLSVQNLETEQMCKYNRIHESHCQ